MIKASDYFGKATLDELVESRGDRVVLEVDADKIEATGIVQDKDSIYPIFPANTDVFRKISFIYDKYDIPGGILTYGIPDFVLDKDILSYPSNLDVLSHIAKLVNEGFYDNGGRLRGVPVTIGGSTYKPELPIEVDVKEDIKTIIDSRKDIPTKAIELCLYCMKKQIFIDGNKRKSFFCVSSLFKKSFRLQI